MKYRFLEEIALADTAFEAFGRNESELFGNAALAVSETMAETKKLKPKEKREIELKSDTLELLLHSWLSELVYLKDVEETIFSRFKVKIIKEKKRFKLNAQIAGQRISEIGPDVIKTDVKAVTWHEFRIEKTKKGFTARVVLDV